MRGMRVVGLGLVALLVCVAGSVQAADYVWRGVNTADLFSFLDPGPYDLGPFVNANTVVTNTHYLWKTGGTPGGVPGSGDLAEFIWDTSQDSRVGGRR